jgi:hypothetical protein
MCREALKHYLATALPGEKADALARLVDSHDAATLDDAESVLTALRAVKVCDPACGSGAHLLGMLHELLVCGRVALQLGAVSRSDAATIAARPR